MLDFMQPMPGGQLAAGPGSHGSTNLTVARARLRNHHAASKIGSTMEKIESN